MNIIQRILNVDLEFTEDEWLLKHKIKTVSWITSILSSILFLFMFIRFISGDITIAVANASTIVILFSLIILLKRGKQYYTFVSISFIFILTSLVTIGLFTSEHEIIRGIWLIPVLVLAYYLRDKKEGAIWLLINIAILLVSMTLNPDPYLIGYLVVIASMFLISLLLYSYDTIKEKEQQEVLKQKEKLEYIVKDRTKELHDLNANLEEKVKVATKELKLKNKDLEESLSNFENILDATMELIILHEVSGEILDINEAGIKMLGLQSKDEVLNKSILDYVQESELPKLQTSMQKESSEAFEIDMIKDDGSLINVLMTGRNILRNGKKIRISTVVNLTTIKWQEKHIVQQSRLAQMGEMLSMIAHQWRQPLSAISAVSANITLKAHLGKLDTTIAIESAEKISQYSQHLSSTINDFRDFFKPNKEKNEITYTKIIQDVLNIIETSIVNQNIKLVKILNSKDTFHTYPNEIKQVILNILKNAEDILIEKEIKNPTIIIKTSDNILTISDNGGGIPADIIDNIFDPYFSTKLEKNGTGLGLYMSKIIIEEHCAGKLSVNNTKDGVKFNIEL